MTNMSSEKSTDDHAPNTAADGSEKCEQYPLINSSTNPVCKIHSTENGNNSMKDLSTIDCVNKQRPAPERAVSCYDNAPDGGWGWVVTFAAFMVGVILDGISFSFGLFFKELLVHFNASKSLTSWVSSAFNGTYLGIGKYICLLFFILL